LIRDKIEEDARLEYKAAASIGREDKRKQEITKDVSSLANASGGTIIYGIAESRAVDAPRLPERIDPVNATDFSKEWLDQIIGQIRPRIPGLEISAIQIGANASDYVYVVDVPQSSTAHQSLDCRYYARRNFEATAMVDYEVRDVMQRSVHPTVDAEIRIIADFPFDRNSHIAIRLKNVGEIMARHYAVVVRMPLRNSHGVIFIKDGTLNLADGPSSTSVSFTNSGGAPLFPGSTVMLSSKFEHKQGVKRQDGGEIPESIKSVEIDLYADNMPRLSLTKNFTDAQLQWI